jgi:hypothetical protein
MCDKKQDAEHRKKEKPCEPSRLCEEIRQRKDTGTDRGCDQYAGRAGE